VRIWILELFSPERQLQVVQKGKEKVCHPNHLGIPNPDILDYQVLPSIMEWGALLHPSPCHWVAKKKLSGESPWCQLLKVSLLLITQQEFFSGNQEHWYHEISKERHDFL
jgi:hypothetical protein